MVLVGAQVKAAHFTGEWVRLVLVAITALAMPAAWDAFHNLLTPAWFAWLTADGGGYLLYTTWPLHLWYL